MEDATQRTEFYYDWLPPTRRDGSNYTLVAGAFLENAIGRIAMIWTPKVIELFSYTDGGKIKRKRVEGAGKWLEASFEYDTQGRLSAVVIPGGRRFTYGYTPGGRLETINHDSVVAGRLQVDAMGRLGALERYGASAEQFGYDAAGDCRFISARAGTTYTSVTGRADRDGRLKSKRDNLSSVVTEYTYDEIGRLTAAGPQGFRYDGFGNLYENTGVNAENRVTQLESAKNQLGASFNAAGNELWHSSVTYDYDTRMLTALGGVGVTESYEYAADGKRVLRSRGVGHTELTLWVNGHPSRDMGVERKCRNKARVVASGLSKVLWRPIPFIWHRKARTVWARRHHIWPTEKACQ